MAPRTYLNFDLLFEPEGNALFRARVVDSPDGSHPFVDFALPFDPLTLENLLLKLDPGRSATRRGAAGPQVEAGRQLGGALFDAVFADDVAVAWARARDEARAQQKGVRLRLHLSDAAALAGLPWELLYDSGSNTFLAQSERTPVVRFLDVAHSQPALRVDGALRILVVISAPTDLAELDVEAEWTHVQEALAARTAAGQVAVDRLPEATLGELGRWLRTHQVHVLHFIGHGDLDPRTDDGVLYFCDEHGRSSPVSASVLGPYVLDHDPLRLIVLNACRSASTGASDPFSGMAQGLVQQQAAAVVAMQFPITDRAATAFAEEFYGAVADGFPVDQAVTSARKALWAGYGAEWATPTVFLHTQDGRVFDAIVAARETPTSGPSPSAEPSRGPEPSSDPEAPDVEPAPSGEQEGSEADVAYVYGQPHRHHRGRTVLLGAGGTAAAVAAGLIWLNLPSGDPAATAPTATPADSTAGSRPDSTASGTTGATAGGTTGAAPPPDGTTARATRLTARIDVGDAEWEGATRYFSDRAVAGSGEPPVWAEWRLGWDDDYYYVYVTVQDPAFTATHLDDPSQLWHGDSVHFEFGVSGPDVPAGALDARDRHVLIGPSETGQVVVQLNVPNTSRQVFRAGPRSTGAQAGVAFSDDGYAVEAAIPWSELTGSTPAAGARFVTNLNVSDARSSGELTGQINSMWSNNLKRSDNVASTRVDWGVVELAG